MDPRGGEVEHPSDIVRGNEVPGRPQHVRAQDRPRVEGAIDVDFRHPLCSKTDRPFGSGIILGLHRARPSNDLGWTSKLGTIESVVAKSTANEIHVSGLGDSTRDGAGGGDGVGDPDAA
jgi:hypothetical protein